MFGLRREHHFSQSEVRKISNRFRYFAEDGCMSLEGFKISMGLMGVGEAEYLSNRIFTLITDSSYCTVQEFIQFLEKINNGSYDQRLYLSFRYLTKGQVISYSDIEVIINEIAFVWNFLTGEKINPNQLVEFISLKLGISESRSITLGEYSEKYDQQFNWYQFFNNPHQPSQYHTLRNNHNQLKIEQVEEYLKLIHNQLETLLYNFKEEEEGEQNTFDKEMSRKGPKTVSAQELQLKGDFGHHYRDTIPCLSQEQLEQELSRMQTHSHPHDLVADKLEHLSDISAKLFKNREVGRMRERTSSRLNMEEDRKKTLKNITQPSQKRKNIVYFGHQNWNIMLNMMLGVRRSLKSHYYKFELPMVLRQEDVTCKYYHELIYKQNDKSIKEISEIFVVYSPKVFFYIRHYFHIDQIQVLKSIGLENLIGNLVLGNLSTLTDQTSEGKSGSFIYYTADSRILVKSISREEYLKLRNIVEDYAHFIEKNPQTYLMAIYGLYKMKNKSSGRTIYFIVVGNVFDQDIHIHQRYDVKGATYNRQVITQVEEGKQIDKNVALKDMDLINNHHRTFNIDYATKEQIYKQILKDALFLVQHNIIEYSLLIGVHYCGPYEGKSQQSSIFDKNRGRGVLSKNKKEIYFFGIIDLLSEYTASRKFQSSFFSLLNYDISCKDPQEYYQRFKNFIYKYVFST